MKKIQVQDLDSHKSFDDGWVIFNQKEVINVSKFNHPGGQSQITPYYGKDITQILKDTGHSEVAYQMINKMKIGEVESSAPKFFTKEEIAKHNTLQDGWVLYGNDVIDVTQFAKKHPGGEESFADFLGGVKDMKQAYDEADHSSSADDQLKKHKIGELGKMRDKDNQSQKASQSKKQDDQLIDINKGIIYQLFTKKIKKQDYINLVYKANDQDCVMFDNKFVESYLTKTKW